MMDSDQTTIPPRGDYQKAESYIAKLADLVEENKIQVVHTDLKKFDPNSLQDHYRIDLKEYQIEISHSKLPNSGADSYVMLFTNLKNIEQGSTEKVILAYTQLSDTQFHKFKTTADTQIEERIRQEEEQRFHQALAPIDHLLDQAASNPASAEPPAQTNTPEPVESHSAPEPVEIQPEESNPATSPSFETPEFSSEPQSDYPYPVDSNSTESHPESPSQEENAFSTQY